ncbi:restriction endonuclease subunit S [Raoultella planticola]|uniref:restriction endonuclease subunit S n=1 Tax=Raoultella planticola TaxID=575 RepID=UPI0036D68E26
MGNKWVHAKLGDHIHSNLGKMLDQNKNKGDLQPYLGNSNVRWGYFDLENLSLMKFEEHESDRYGIRKGDLIICEGGEPGRCAIWEDDVPNMKIQKALHRVRPRPGLTSEYLYYWFLYFGRTGQLDAYFTGTTIKHLTGKALFELPIKIPTLDEQKYISIVLGSLDAKIKANRKINRTLEQMSQTLFKSWFVDFDPVIDNALDAGNPIPETLQSRAELRQKVRNSSDLKPLPADIRALFPAEFEETELGWVPKGWKISTAGDELVVKGGSTPSTSNPDFWENGTTHWTSPKDLTGNDSKVLLDTSKKITELGLKKISSGLLPTDTVLMSSRAPIGYLALAKTPMAINQGYIAIPSSKNLSPEYIIYWLENIMDDIKAIAGGTTFAEISKGAFKTISLVIPSKNIVGEFTRLAHQHFEKVVSNTEQITALTNLRDTLLPKLISGELSLEDLPNLVAQTEPA